MSSLPGSNKYWPIVHKDKYPDPPKKEIICNNCGERGHMRYKCRNPPKPKTCYMCGLAGHQEVRCPNTLCLKVSSIRSFSMIAILMAIWHNQSYTYLHPFQKMHIRDEKKFMPNYSKKKKNDWYNY